MSIFSDDAFVGPNLSTNNRTSEVALQVSSTFSFTDSSPEISKKQISCSLEKGAGNGQVILKLLEIQKNDCLLRWLFIRSKGMV